MGHSYSMVVPVVFHVVPDHTVLVELTLSQYRGFSAGGCGTSYIVLVRWTLSQYGELSGAQWGHIVMVRENSLW